MSGSRIADRPGARVEHVVVGSAPELFRQLCELVDGLLVEPGRFMVIETPSGRFVQAAAAEWGGLQVESVAQEFATAMAAPLTSVDEARLAHLGWRPPGPHTPNWLRALSEPWPWPAPVVAELFGRTLLEIHEAAGTILAVTLGTTSPNFEVERCDARCAAATSDVRSREPRFAATRGSKQHACSFRSPRARAGDAVTVVVERTEGSLSGATRSGGSGGTANPTSFGIH